MKQRSKNHHYVPQSILKNFSIENKEKQIFAFDKSNDKTYILSIENAGSEKYFYSIRKDGQEFNFEDYFENADSFLANIINKIITESSLLNLNSHERKGLYYITALQMLRTRETLNELKNINNFLFDITKQISADLDIQISDVEPELEEFDEEKAKSTFLKLKNQIFKYASILENKITTLSTTKDDDPFWCSDNPVVQNNVFGFGDNGLISQGTDIYFPISKNLIISFNCRSKFYEGENKAELINSKEYEAWLNLLNFSAKKEASAENVLYYNSLQVVNSSRFIYSNLNTFDMARMFLTDYPKYRTSKSKSAFKIVKNKNQKDYPEYPVGLFLFCIGQKSNHTFEVVDYEFNDMIFCTKDKNVIQSIMAEKEIRKIKFIRDGDFYFEVVDIKIEIIEELTGKFKIKFNNPEIEKIIMRQ